MFVSVLINKQLIFQLFLKLTLMNSILLKVTSGILLVVEITV